jgi:phosphorylcholine metabolism protein LicD
MKFIYALSVAEDYQGKYKFFINKFSLFKSLFKKIMEKLIKDNSFYRKAGYQHPYSFVKEISKREFNNLLVKIPNDYEEYLSYIYGSSWRVPKKKFNWLKDSPATKLYEGQKK